MMVMSACHSESSSLPVAVTKLACDNPVMSLFYPYALNVRKNMNIKIIATRNCSHRSNLEKELKDLAVAYEVIYVEDHPETVSRYHIRHSPNLVVDDEVVCRGQPGEDELKRLLKINK